MELKNLFAGVLVAGLMAGCATAPDATAPKKELTEPEMVQLTDPNPFANYAPAMVSSAEFPLTVNWQDAHKAEVAEATKPETLAKFLESDLTAGKLLAEVKEAYKTEPIVMMQIASISQLVMCPKCPKAPKNRAKWTAALLAAAKDAPDTYRQMFFLDQLRWCGKPAQADRVLQVGRKSGSRAVNDFAMMVAVELAQIGQASK